MMPREPETVRLALLPIAWQFAAGSRIRLSFAGTDMDHFAHIPFGRLPVFTVTTGGEGASLTLPLRR